jgi:hypothetical protein
MPYHSGETKRALGLRTNPENDWDGQNSARERGEGLICEILEAETLESARDAARQLPADFTLRAKLRRVQMEDGPKILGPTARTLGLDTFDPVNIQPHHVTTMMSPCGFSTAITTTWTCQAVHYARHLLSPQPRA